MYFAVSAVNKGKEVIFQYGIDHCLIKFLNSCKLKMCICVIIESVMPYIPG